MIGTWTAEQFHFISIDETNTFTPSSDTQQNDTLNDNPILAFNEALTTYGVTKQLLPDELPTGFEQIEFEITEKPSGDIRLHACYKNGDDSIVLDANICSNNTSTAVFEKTDEKDSRFYKGRGGTYCGGMPGGDIHVFCCAIRGVCGIYELACAFASALPDDCNGRV